MYIKHPFKNQCQVQSSFANTNFSARLKFPAAATTVATTTTRRRRRRCGRGRRNLYVLPSRTARKRLRILSLEFPPNANSAYIEGGVKGRIRRRIGRKSFVLSPIYNPLAYPHTRVFFHDSLSCLENYFHYRAWPINATFVISVFDCHR